MEKLGQNIIDFIKSNITSEVIYDADAIQQEYQQEETQTTLSIKILSVLGGFLGTLSFVVFLFAIDLWDSKPILITLGCFLICGAIVLNKFSKKLITDTFSISMYGIGFIVLTYALFESGMNADFLAFIISAISLGSLFITQNYMLSVISILLINGSIYQRILEHNHNFAHIYVIFSSLIFTFLMLNEAKIVTTNVSISRLYNPFRISILVTFLAGLFYLENIFVYTEILSVVLILICLFLVSKILKINQVTDIKIQAVVYVLSLLVLIGTLFYPPISGTLIIILLSFLANYKTGFVIGIIAFIYFISRFYYNLDFTLLTKSIILFFSGIVFLLFYVLISKNTVDNEKI